ncbi:MAG: 3-deoxy-manno-octulosonate cytidylyltransferase [Gammaproteobacteria bacterium]|nr:3-deoxy-manno-octulosonate cytidylyltransferase [Gammaproteobacteria bacterium]
MAFIALIPARMASSRLPGKPLVDIGGKPMIQHVYERAVQSKADEVLIVTDAAEIQDAATGFGASTVMTSVEHSSGTSRLAEAASILGLPDNQIVVNVQGDEPLIPPAAIDQLAEALTASTADMATLASPLNNYDDMLNANVVKVVTDARSEALYFSRAAIPFNRDESQTGLASSMQHIGLYAYRTQFLNAYQTWDETVLEKIEQLEQLRALYYGARILVSVMQDHHSPGVDTIEDLEKVRELIGCYD